MNESQKAFETRAHKLFETGNTAIFACKADPRFSYCLYVPPHLLDGSVKPELVVAMHGTGRTFVSYRNALSSFARWNDCIVLCPLFPAGVLGDDNRDGFKYIIERNIRYDQVLDYIIEEVAVRYRITIDRFALFGYSGGGHFVHRYLILRPQRLWAASIGAPGSVTLLDDSKDWWVGTRNVAELFGSPVDIEAMRGVEVHMVVGTADLETWEITHRQGGAHWMAGANDAGKTRPDRLASLRKSFEAFGITVDFDLVPGMSHDGIRSIPYVTDFLARALKARRGIPAEISGSTSGTLRNQ